MGQVLERSGTSLLHKVSHGWGRPGKSQGYLSWASSSSATNLEVDCALIQMHSSQLTSSDQTNQPTCYDRYPCLDAYHPSQHGISASSRPYRHGHASCPCPCCDSASCPCLAPCCDSASCLDPCPCCDSASCLLAPCCDSASSRHCPADHYS